MPEAQTTPVRETKSARGATREAAPAADGRFVSAGSGVAEDPSGTAKVFVLRDVVCYQGSGDEEGEVQLPMQSYRLEDGRRQIDVHLPPDHPQVEVMEKHVRAALAAMDYDEFTVDRETL